jgi:hypothetical protein
MLYDYIDQARGLTGMRVKTRRQCRANFVEFIEEHECTSAARSLMRPEDLHVRYVCVIQETSELLQMRGDDLLQRRRSFGTEARRDVVVERDRVDGFRRAKVEGDRPTDGFF